MNIRSVIKKIGDTMDSGKMPLNVLPAPLLKCLSLKRTGLSAYKTCSQIIEDCAAAGIPVGVNPDGTPNLINTYSYILVKNIFDAMRYDMKITTAIPMDSLLIQAVGGNAGGPVTVTGTNLLDSIASGIAQ